jgi:CheY-like chemotaxis protein
VEAVPQAYYDLALMDVRTLEMDGYAATAAIRERERAQGAGRHTPIVALTAYALGEDVEKSLAAGMGGHVTKPMTVERWIAPSAREASGQAASASAA